MSRSIAAGTLIGLLASTLMAAATAQAQTTWYVDDDAPNDPRPGDPNCSDPNENGSAGHPFDAIAEGITAAVNGDTVLVLDGTYTGTSNEHLDFGGHGRKRAGLRFRAGGENPGNAPVVDPARERRSPGP